MSKSDDYTSFLVRLWRETEDRTSEWRGEVEHIQSGQRRKFAAFDELAAFLRQQMEGAPRRLQGSGEDVTIGGG